MNDKKELEELVIRKLVSQGEVCMPRLIAETLIVREIIRRLYRKNKRIPAQEEALKPLDILQGVLIQVRSLAENSAPLIYLKMKPTYHR